MQSDPTLNELKNLIDMRKKRKFGKLLEKYLQSRKNHLNSIQFFESIAQLFFYNPDYFISELYEKYYKISSRYSNLANMEEYIISKYSLYPSEKIGLKFSGKLTQDDIILKGRFYVTQHRIIGHGKFEESFGSTMLMTSAVGNDLFTGMMFNKAIQSSIRKKIQRAIEGDFPSRNCFGFQYPIINPFRVEKTKKEIKYSINIEYEKRGKVKNKRLKIKLRPTPGYSNEREKILNILGAYIK